MLKPTLEAGVTEWVVHLCRVKMNFHDSVVEDVHLALLIDDIMDVKLIGKGFNDCFARPRDPDIDVAALAAARVRVQPRKPRAFQHAAAEPFALEERLQLRDQPFVPGVDLCDSLRKAVPVVEEMLRR